MIFINEETKKAVLCKNGFKREQDYQGNFLIVFLGIRTEARGGYREELLIDIFLKNMTKIFDMILFVGIHHPRKSNLV